MFEKFGEFDSVEELNEKAEELLAAGNTKELIALAVENGLDRGDAEDYIDGEMLELASAITAALGKLELESKDLKLSGVLEDWVQELVGLVMVGKGWEDFARAVRRKGKSLAEYIALTADSGYEKRCVVDKRIVEKTKEVKKIVGSHEFSIGIPDKKTRKELAIKYYMG